MITVDPTMQRIQPRTPTRCNFSFSMKWARTALPPKITKETHTWICQTNPTIEFEMLYVRAKAWAILPDNDAECSQRSDEDGWRKHVSHEIGGLPNKH